MLLEEYPFSGLFPPSYVPELHITGECLSVSQYLTIHDSYDLLVVYRT